MQLQQDTVRVASTTSINHLCHLVAEPAVPRSIVPWNHNSLQTAGMEGILPTVVAAVRSADGKRIDHCLHTVQPQASHCLHPSSCCTDVVPSYAVRGWSLQPIGGLPPGAGLGADPGLSQIQVPAALGEALQATCCEIPVSRADSVAPARACHAPRGEIFVFSTPEIV